VTELGSDYFQYDEIKNELRGERTGIRYRLSDRVRVQVSRVDLDARKIDFRLVRDTPVKPAVNRGAQAQQQERGAAEGGARVRPMPLAADDVRRKKAAPPQSAAVKEARAARGAAKTAKKRAPSKPAAKKSPPRKKR
jgi:ribonuclease R